MLFDTPAGERGLLRRLGLLAGLLLVIGGAHATGSFTLDEALQGACRDEAKIPPRTSLSH